MEAHDSTAHDLTTHAAMVLHLLRTVDQVCPFLSRSFGHTCTLVGGEETVGTMGCNESLSLRAFLKQGQLKKLTYKVLVSDYRVGKHTVISHANHSIKNFQACWPHPQQVQPLILSPNDACIFSQLV